MLIIFLFNVIEIIKKQRNNFISSVENSSKRKHKDITPTMGHIRSGEARGGGAKRTRSNAYTLVIALF